MSVDPEVSRQIMVEELTDVVRLGSSYGWAVRENLPSLKITVEMSAHDGERFVLEADCLNYKEWPPFFEFSEPASGERGTKRAYPKSTDSFFHPSGPCICAPFNRKAYKGVVDTGPHGDWRFGDWMTSRANGYDWSHVKTLADMFNTIQSRLLLRDLYKGRMG